MRKLRWIAEGLLVCVFIVSGSQAQPQDQPTRTQDRPTIAFITPHTITRGDTITITGTNLSKNGARTIVRIDNHETRHVEVLSSEKIKVFVNTDPKSEAKSKGEYERVVVVIVDGQPSESCYLHQLTWRVILKPRVFIPLFLYLAAVALILFGVERARGSVFRSKTGQLSLSKIQMGVWTFVFGLAYVVLAASWREFLDITEGMFWLMGISSATAVGAKAIVLKNLKELDDSHPSRFLSDYDKESNNYRLSLHRCQIALWTLIVLVVYLVQLIGTMHFPDIPDKLLVLMGVSGGTYLGFNYKVK